MNDDELRRLLETLRTESAEAHKQTRRHMDVVGERLDGRIDRLTEAVFAVDQKIDRTSAELREEIQAGFAETRAMIKFSHADLDRRVQTLEEGLSDLRARVERLEGSQHN